MLAACFLPTTSIGHYSKERVMGWFSSRKSDKRRSDREVSAYDGKPLNTYTGTVNGRRVTVRSSWKPGDPDR